MSWKKKCRMQNLEVLKMTVSRNKVDSSTLTKTGILSILYQTGFNFERMQAPSFALSLLPGLRKIYGDNDEEICKALLNNMDFINTEQHVGSFLVGLVLSMEEAGEDRSLIKNIKTGLFGPLAGFGDAVVWFTFLPITAAIAASLARQGSPLGPIFFLAFWTLLSFSRILIVKFGYRLGANAVDSISRNAKYITKAAGILGVCVLGAMIPNYVSLAFSEDLVLFETVGVQSIFDSVIPNLLPAAAVAVTYALFKKKVNIVVIILAIIAFCILMAALGWM